MTSIPPASRTDGRGATAFSPFTASALPEERPLKYTLCFTQRCNLTCSYCYVEKSDAVMSLETAKRVVDFIYRHSRAAAGLDIGFFGGEPLVEFERMRAITALIREHPAYEADRIRLTLTSNGTLFTEAIAGFLLENQIRLCISCDGLPAVQDSLRRTQEGHGSASRVEATLKRALELLPVVLVNAVIHPRTFRHLPESVGYLSDLGLRHVYLNPDYSAAWSQAETEELASVYGRLVDLYVNWYLEGDPHFISVLDSKIAALLRGGIDPLERCRMGSGELAFSPDGGIYPCERLIGNGLGGSHRIGHVDTGINLSALRCRLASPQTTTHPDAAPAASNPECIECGIRDTCMNWCGCSNTFMTGFYDRVGPFLCASERAAITSALQAMRILGERLGPVFLDHFLGRPHSNSKRVNGEQDLACPL